MPSTLSSRAGALCVERSACSMGLAGFRYPCAVVTVASAFLLLVAGCEEKQVEQAQKSASQAREGAVAAGEAAREGLTGLEERGAGLTQQAGEAASAAKEESERLLRQAHEAVVRPDGEDVRKVSQQTTAWLQGVATEAHDSIEAAIVAGPPLLGVAVDAAKVIDDAVDSETRIEPVYQELGDEAARQRVDRAIGGMPRTEIIDGLQVGFRDLSSTDTGRRLDERGFLVLWRRDDHLVGFVYRSQRAIDLEAIVAETPRLVRAFRTATAADGE